jgi:uncharacterized membrane-anchored protein
MSLETRWGLACVLITLVFGLTMFWESGRYDAIGIISSVVGAVVFGLGIYFAIRFFMRSWSGRDDT